MTKEELAGKLHGRPIGNEITKAEAQEARQSRLVVIFGASDDLCELRGAINDELDSYRECLIFIERDGRLLREINDEDTKILSKYDALRAVLTRHDKATKVSARWCKTPEYSWTYETTAPHASFDVMEDDETYCRGIVIDLKELG